MLIKFACAQPEITAGQPDLNTQKIINLIKEAALNKADILLLPELAVPGYLIGDLWEQKSFWRTANLWRRNYKGHFRL